MITVFVSHNCVQARITEANITATNGVIHVIDTLLGFTYNDLYTEMKSNIDLQ